MVTTTQDAPFLLILDYPIPSTCSIPTPSQIHPIFDFQVLLHATGRGTVFSTVNCLRQD